MLDPIAVADRAHAIVSRAMRELLRSLLEIERAGLWDGDGARDLPHWIQMRYGVSNWEARRWLRAAHALEELPRLSDALETGRLCLDKVLELCRFVTPETETDLIRWASRVSMATVRRRADAEVRRTRDDLVEVERSRFLDMWYSDEGRRFGMEAELPAAEGASIERAIERLMRDIPTMPDEEDEMYAPARRADALVAMASSALGGEGDRAMVVVHASLAALSADGPGGEVEDGPPVAATTVQRLLCTSRFQTVVEDEAWRSASARDSRRHGCSARCVTAIASAGSPAAARDDSPRPTTSPSGATAGRRRSRTSCWSAGSTTGSSTSTAGRSNVWPTARCDGDVPTTHLRDGPPARAPTERMIA